MTDILWDLYLCFQCFFSFNELFFQLYFYFVKCIITLYLNHLSIFNLSVSSNIMSIYKKKIPCVSISSKYKKFSFIKVQSKYIKSAICKQLERVLFLRFALIVYNVVQSLKYLFEETKIFVYDHFINCTAHFHTLYKV